LADKKIERSLLLSRKVTEMAERRVEAEDGVAARHSDLADMGRSLLRPYEEKAVDAGARQRRSGRVSEQVAVVMLGSDAEGRVFSEATHTWC
jgi:hypothetical protein